ncbi:MAG: patatin-like phospholipase family protein [bacterium]
MATGRREGVGICLSGGGYRAVLFHLGALRRLHELGILARPDLRVSSVSGGSFVAAVWAAAVARNPNWHADWIRDVESPLRALTRQDVRTRALALRLLPWNWTRGHVSAESVAGRLHALAGVPLSDMPVSPEFRLCSTDLAFGANWEFRRDEMGDWLAGYVKTSPEWTLARAAAASACFPPLFGPVPVRVPASEFRRSGAKRSRPEQWQEAIGDLRLTDGGNYDNLGLEPVWKRVSWLLVSDAGGAYQFQSDRNFLWRLMRYAGTLESQCRSLRKRWLMSGYRTVFGGAYWSVRSATSRFPGVPADEVSPAEYSKAFAFDVVARIRTDLDAFSEGEAAVLMNHGYFTANRAVLAHAPELVAGTAPPLAAPEPGWAPPALVEEELRRRLAGSDRRRVFGRRATSG